MPFLNGHNVYSHLCDLYLVPVKFTTTAGTGVVASSNAPPLVTVVRASAGTYTITSTDAPYYKCVAALVSFYQTTLDTAPSVIVLPMTDASGTTATVKTLVSGAAADFTNAATVSVVLFFQKAPVA